MRRSVLILALTLTLATSGDLLAQGRIMGPQPTRTTLFGLELLGRQEWTKRRFREAPDDNLWLLRARPRLELGSPTLTAGVGGDFHYGSDENTQVADGLDLDVATIPDNYDSRSARLDLAFLRLKPSPWLHLEGGLFEMGLPLTEMIWDRDLRAQGGMGKLTFQVNRQGTALTGAALYTKASHVFADKGTSMVAIAANATFATGLQTFLQMGGGYVQFRGHAETDGLDPRLYRQNTTVDGTLAHDYRVADGQLHIRSEGSMPLEVYVDYCWNTAVSEANHGLWGGVLLGSVEQSRARLEYTYARIDRDATLGAYNTDDFLWSTGVEAHRAELATTSGPSSSLHLIAQLQRPKDSPDADEARHWVRRFRIELRVRTF